MTETTRDELLDELVRMTRARDLLADTADRVINQRDRLAQGLRLIRDTTAGVAPNIAGRALDEAGVPDPEEVLPPERVEPPTCAGTDRHHRDKPMVLIGLEDDGTYIWRCPRCLYIWRERP